LIFLKLTHLAESFMLGIKYTSRYDVNVYLKPFFDMLTFNEIQGKLLNDCTCD